MDDKAGAPTNLTENVTDIAPLETSGPKESAAAAGGTRVRRRFKWPMRIALGYFVFDMVARSLITLTPFNGDWRTELEMARFPLRLASTEQRQRIGEGADAKYDSVAARHWASVRSAFFYWSPLPREKTAAHLESASDWGKYAVVWVGTRLSFVGALLGVDEDWPMFSPNVRRVHIAPRVKLTFADGTSQQLFLLSEPVDPTSFHRWFVKRPLQIDLRLAKDYDARLGVSRYLAERYAENESGSPLRYLEMHEVKYSLPKPGQDAFKVLSKQARKPTKEKPFWRYDVKTGKGQTFDEKKEKEKEEKAAKERAEREQAAFDRVNPPPALEEEALPAGAEVQDHAPDPVEAPAAEAEQAEPEQGESP